MLACRSEMETVGPTCTEVTIALWLGVPHRLKGIARRAVLPTVLRAAAATVDTRLGPTTRRRTARAAAEVRSVRAEARAAGAGPAEGRARPGHQAARPPLTRR